MEAMIVKRFDEQNEIVALDNTRVREFLNPKHDKECLHLSYSLAHASLAPGKSSLPHRFLEASEVYYILRGKGMMHIDDEVAEVGPGDAIYIPPMGIQYIENISDENLDFLAIVNPAWQSDAEELV